jgi:uncharacterized protein (DUF488 family)
MTYTIGHSTHTAEAFVALLRAHGVTRLADVRRIPASRRHPQFTQAALQAFLEGHGIVYRHFPALGGLRKPRPDSINTGWQHPGFRGYADYMSTSSFMEGLDDFQNFSAGIRTALMCAEAVWWQCHRRLLADALLVRGVPVLHILPSGEAKPHELSEFARESGGGVLYPGLL